ncbi:hypothetical protein [Xanthocytophaga agilis]|uniref:Uncharacterized protein n=1 Tax=Xanthocytophaga agilis TaxID=3048010 RepID=A0AAE3RE13_9BACT|nr:hypothetical protein [Xanthocytophaga agilis]MDJ1506093.1 hypothetical protein [Xanthocytophaga agilis]
MQVWLDISPSLVLLPAIFHHFAAMVTLLLAAGQKMTTPNHSDKIPGYIQAVFLW